MLSPTETKVVLSTLTQRRAWLKKSLDDGKVDENQRNEFTKTLTVLDSAMQKLAAAKPAPSQTTNGQAAFTKTAKREKLSMDNARVLVAEDQEDSRQMLVDILEDIGLKAVDEATDGRDAFDKIKSKEDGYDIILCDWDMPELSGIEVHNKAKASNKLKGAYFCMVTGMTESDKIREAISKGVNDYIAKPVDSAILETKIKATIEAKNNA